MIPFVDVVYDGDDYEFEISLFSGYRLDCRRVNSIRRS